MEWYQNPYFGETAGKKKEKLLKQLNAGKNPTGLLLIALAVTEQNQLELLSPAAYRTRFAHSGEAPLIVGAACGRAEAEEVLCRMTEDVYRETGTAELRRWFAEQ